MGLISGQAKPHRAITNRVDYRHGIEHESRRPQGDWACCW
jgi:hypothetical protein